MVDASRLAVAYIARNPQSASRVLASTAPQEAAAFLSDIPVEQAASLIACSTPPTAARIVQKMDDKAVAAVFLQLPLVQAAAIVRQLARPARTALVSKLPKRTQIALQRQLVFSADSIGAHMTTAVCTFRQSDSVGTALDVVRQSDRVKSDVLFVLDDTGRLAGVTSIATALRHSGDTHLSAIMETSCPEIAAQNRLRTLTNPALWSEFTLLPVVNRQRIVIGAISRKALTTAMLTENAVPIHPSPPVLSSVIGALATTSEGLLRLLLPSTTGSAKAGSSNGS